MVTCCFTIRPRSKWHEKVHYMLLKNLIQKALVQMVIELQQSCVRMAWFYIVSPCNHWHSTCKEATSASLQIPTLSSGMIIFHTLWHHITCIVNTTAHDTKISPSVLTHYPVMINTLQTDGIYMIPQYLRQ